VAFSVYRSSYDLTDTPYGKLVAAGAPTVPLFFVLTSGRIQQLNAVADPDPERTERMGAVCYFTERSPHHAYPMDQWIGQPTPGEALAEAITGQTERIASARKRLAKLEAGLVRYNAAAEALGG
jgi:hypothetical protein